MKRRRLIVTNSMRTVRLTVALAYFYVCSLFSVAHIVAGQMTSDISWPSNKTEPFGVMSDPSYFTEYVFERINTNSTATLNFDQFESLISMLSIGGNDTHRNFSNSTSEDGEKQCLSAWNILEIYGLVEEDGSPFNISLGNFSALCPALIQQQISKNCHSQHKTKNNTSSAITFNSSTTERIGFGTLAVAIISLLPLVCFVIIPKPDHRFYPHVISGLIALATSTLVSDAVLHLIPEIMGIDKTKSSTVNADSTVIISDMLRKQVMIIVSIYAMYLFGILMDMGDYLKKRDDTSKHDPDPGVGHGHSHGRGIHVHTEHVNNEEQCVNKEEIRQTKEDTEDELARSSGSFVSGSSDQRTSTTVLSSVQTTISSLTQLNESALEHDGDPPAAVTSARSFDNQDSSDQAAIRNTVYPTISSFALLEESVLELVEETPPSVTTIYHSSGDDVKNNEVAERNNITAGLSLSNKSRKPCTRTKVTMFFKQWFRECIPSKSYGWIILISDLTHNVMDGIAIGAAFSKSPISGVSTSVAVVFHEIPHEVGDFAALMTAGVSWRGAMTWNILLSMTAFIGLYVGLSVSTDDSARQWVFAITAGVFLHHSLSEFLPELVHIEGNFFAFFIVQNVGILLGFTIMLIILIFEETIHKSVTH